MDNEEMIEQQNAYYMAGYPSRRSENKMNKDEIEKEVKMKVNDIIAISSSSRTVKAGLKTFNSLFNKRQNIKEILNISDKDVKSIIDAIEVMDKIDTIVNSLLIND